MAREYVTQAELEAALTALQEPGRFDGAERLVSQAAPGLHRILLDAFSSGGWGQDDDVRALQSALAAGDPAAVEERMAALIAEHSRVAMLVGVAVGVELARELGLSSDEPPLTITHHGSKEHH